MTEKNELRCGDIVMAHIVNTYTLNGANQCIVDDFICSIDDLGKHAAVVKRGQEEVSVPYDNLYGIQIDDEFIEAVNQRAVQFMIPVFCKNRGLYYECHSEVAKLNGVAEVNYIHELQHFLSCGKLDRLITAEDVKQG